MTRRQRIAGLLGTPRPVSVALFAILLLGVLGMHGLASHGTGGVGHGGMGAAADPLNMSAATEPTDGCDTAVCFRDGHLSVGSGDGPGKGLLTLCVAVLVGVATMLIGALVATRRAGPRQRSRTVPLPTLLRANGPDPPSLQELSLLRC